MKSRGFTLIELLVVISIIGLLSSVVLASLNTARAKARDAKRKGDLVQIRTAIELYVSAHQGAPLPIQGYFSNREIANGNSNINLLQTEGFMSVVPDDPLHGQAGTKTYLHMTKNHTDTTIGTSTCTGFVLQTEDKYAIYAQLENPSAADIATLTGGDSYDQCVAQQVPSYNFKIGN